MWKANAEVEQSKGRLMEDFRIVVLDAEELLKVTASQTGERITAARAKAAESLQAAKARLADVQGIAVEQARVAAKETDVYVRNNPWQAVSIAAIAGVILGAIITRR